MIAMYCERLGSGLWAEPVNIFTNLAFLVGALASWRMASRSSSVPGSIATLIGLMAIIGIGSALFHILATAWAGVLDVVPVLIFQLYFLWLYSRRVVFLRTSYSALAVTSLFVVTLVGRAVPLSHELSLSQVPALVPLLGFGIYHYYAQKRESLTMIAAAGVFALALTFRTLDGVLCPHFPLGTHFLWHLLNSAVAFLAFRGLVSNLRVST